MSEEAGLQEAHLHCQTLVRQEEPDRAVATLFAPPAAQPALNALYAFDIETAGIRDKVRQPLPGEIRLQWWRDTISAGAAQAETDGTGSPIALALLSAIRRYELPPAAFDRLLEARVFDLYDDPMPSRETFEAYAGETASSIIMLAAMILDRSRAPEVAEIAGHAGVVETALRTLAMEDRHRRRGQVFVPGDILQATGLDREAWLQGGERASAARAAMAAYATDHEGKVADGWGHVPRVLRPAFLPVRLAPFALSRLAGGQREGPSAAGPLRRSWIYWRAMRAPEGDG